MLHVSDSPSPSRAPSCADFLPDAAWTARELTRLEQFVPELANTTRRDVLSYALAYVEHYAGNVLQLEQEWEFLSVALMDAWRRSNYPSVIRLVTALAHPVSRLHDYATVTHVLRLGIAACHATLDIRSLTRFINRLAGLLFAHGKYRPAHRLWHTSLELAEGASSAWGLWQPFASFAYTADLLWDYPSARQFAETMLHTCHPNDHESLAVALFIRGFRARHAGDVEIACQDFCHCLQLAMLSSTQPTPYQQLFTLAVQAELARVQEDYGRAQMYTHNALALAQVFSDCYTVSDLLADQLFFTYQHEQFADTRATLTRLYDVIYQQKASYLYQRYHLLEHSMARRLPADIPPPTQQPVELQEPLSEREYAVLRLVAEGHANQEIAHRLVIAPATVKKHLEHIYGKLDAHSRTSALAKARMLGLLTS